MMKFVAQSLLMVAMAQAAVEESCVQEATLSESSAHEVGSLSESPITMVSQDVTTVTVTIGQNWVEGETLGALKIMYTSAGDMTCPTLTGLTGPTTALVADCVDGVATIGLFAGDDRFVGVTDISDVIPDECVVDGETEPAYENYVSAVYLVPCDSTDESFCPVCEDDEPPVDPPVLPPTDDGEDGGGFGDPHLKTWTGEVYDFHGACDLVLVRSQTFHNGAGIEAHIRTIMRDDWSYISTAVIRIGEDTFEVGQKSEYWLNGAGAVDLPSTVGGFPLVVERHGDRRTLFHIDLGHMGMFEVRVFGEFLSVEFHHAHEDGFLDSQGLMGDFKKGTLLGRSGEVIADHNEFGLHWQVRDTDPQLFLHAEGPQYPQLCYMPTATALKERRMSESLVSFEDAEKACADWDANTKEACIYDVMATGDLSMAQAGAF